MSFESQIFQKNRQHRTKGHLFAKGWVCTKWKHVLGKPAAEANNAWLIRLTYKRKEEDALRYTIITIIIIIIIIITNQTI